MKKELEKTIGQMAAESPQFIAVFEKFNLDYYQNGQRTLGNACIDAGVNEEKVRQVMGPPNGFPLKEKVDENSTLSEIINLIVLRHHGFVRAQLEVMESLLVNMGKDDREVSQASLLRTLFLTLDESLRHHLLEEEIEVFPWLLWSERQGGGPGKTQENKNFPKAIHHILLDHRMMDQEFREMKKLTFHFRASNPGSGEIVKFSNILDGLDEDNHLHIHLENNILLRKAAALGILGNS
jgi:regulator of cell morphogenesis and NO signaling